MSELVAVTDGQQSSADHLNQYRDLFRGDYVFDVKSGFGAAGDGVTDDQPAIQAAIDAAGVVPGGGMVWLPYGDYLLTSLAVSDVGTEGHLAIPYSNITIAGVGSILRANDDYAIFWQGDPNLDFRDSTYYNLTGSYAYGAQSITLATAAQASNFAAGDYIAIRTGQTVDGGIGQPDGEFNQVVTANPGTGVITLAWPLAKPYAQEYFITGTDGKTSTTVTANAAIYGVANVSDRMYHDQTFRDLRFISSGSTGTSYAFIGRQLIRTIVDHCSWEGRVGMWSTGAHRFTTIQNCQLHHPGATPTYQYTVTSDTMCGDTTWLNNQITGEHVVSMHCHEGSSKVRIIGNTISCPNGSGDENYISIRARAYDFTITDNLITGATPAALYVDPACTGGGVIANNQFLGTTGYGAFVAAGGWTLTGNRHPNGAKQYSDPYAGVTNELRYLSAWVSSGTQTAVLGILPGRTYVKQCSVQVTQGFNSSGTDLLSVGRDGAVQDYGTQVDVTSTGFQTFPAGGATGYHPDPVTVKAFYANGGTEPNLGKALVTLEYAFVAESP